MLKKEFTELTGFCPTDYYYHTVIEPEYNQSDLDKQEWCKLWKKQGGIQKAYDAIVLKAVSTAQDVEHTQNMNNSLTEENKRLRTKCEDVEDDNILLKKKVRDYESTMYALIHILQKDGNPELRKLIIDHIGFKNYVAYKIENELNLFESDKQEILKNLK